MAKLTIKDQLEIAETNLEIAKETVYRANLVASGQQSDRLKMLYVHTVRLLSEIKSELEKC